MSGALAGVRVIEIGELISGPFCGRLLADHGAEVVKVEPPQTGDPMRRWGETYRGVGLYWPIIGRGKRSLTLDLRTALGQEAFLELICTADVLVENFAPGVLEGWNLGPSILHAYNSDLIVARISGFGQTGPDRDRDGSGGIAEAVGGMRHLAGEAGRPPVGAGISLAESLAGTQAFIGVLLAMVAGTRRPGARGQVIDVALYEAVWTHMESVLGEYEKLGSVRGPVGPAGRTASQVYPTANDEWILIVRERGDAERLAHVLSRPDWLAACSGHEPTDDRDIEDEIAAETSKRSTPELLASLRQAGVPAAHVYTAADIARDAQYAAREMVLRVSEPSLGGEKLPMPGVVPKLSGTAGAVSGGAPLLGEHNDSIWPDVVGPDGYSNLVKNGVV